MASNNVDLATGIEAGSSGEDHTYPQTELSSEANIDTTTGIMAWGDGSGPSLPSEEDEDHDVSSF